MEPVALASASVPAGAAGTLIGVVGVLLTALWLALLWR